MGVGTAVRMGWVGYGSVYSRQCSKVSLSEGGEEEKGRVRR